MPAAKSPLLGRYLNWGDGEYYSTFLIEHDLSAGFYLLRYMNGKTNEPLGSSRVVHLGQLIEAGDNVAIYDDLASVDCWGEEEDSGRVLSLVPRK